MKKINNLFDLLIKNRASYSVSFRANVTIFNIPLSVEFKSFVLPYLRHYKIDDRITYFSQSCIIVLKNK